MEAVIRTSTAMSFVPTVACSILLCVAPFYSSGQSVLQVSGLEVLSALALPILASLVPILFPRRAVRIGSAAVLCFFVLAGGFSIGMLYAPSALLPIPGCLRAARERGHR